MASRRILWVLGLLVLPGCCAALPDVTGPAANVLARRVLDPEPMLASDPSMRPATKSDDARPTPLTGTGKEGVTILPDQVPQKDKTQPKEPLVIPRDLPGSGAPPLIWPKTEKERERALKTLYPELPPLPSIPQPDPGPTGRPLTLSDLQSLATANNPTIKGAVAGVAAAKGAVIQSATYPNPSLFWESDTVNTAGAGYQGAGIDQPIKGANKIKLARAAAEMDLRNAQLALKRAQSDLATQVRSNYFAVLVAAENVKVSRALAVFTNNVYYLQLNLFKAEQAAPYEPLLLRPLASQARFNLIQALNQYQASWKQLAAALGLPAMPPTQLAGRVDMPVPVFDYDRVLQRALNQHSDIQTALNTVQKNRYLLELAQVQPIPDFDIHVLIQKDYTTPPHLLVYSAALTFPIPLWDRNRGNILQAQNQVLQTAQSVTQTKLQLTSTLADAYNRYRTAHEEVQIVVGQIENEAQGFIGVYKRHREVEGVSTFADVVTAEQALVTYISTYITALGLQWTAVVDVANLLQTDDLFGLGQSEQVLPVPDLEQLLPEACPTPRRPLLHTGRTLADALGVPGTTEPLRLPLEPARPEFAPAFIPAAGNVPGPRPSLSFADQLPAAVAAPPQR